MSGRLHLKAKPTKTKAKKKAYIAFQKYLRRFWTLKKPIPCYTCDKPQVYEKIQVGHWVEGHSNTTYINEDYVRPQCFYCNIQLGGNQGEFRDRIRKELGDEVVNQLLIDAKLSKDISVQDYIALEEWYKDQLQKID